MVIGEGQSRAPEEWLGQGAVQLHQEQGHVVMLGSGGGEAVRLAHNMPQDGGRIFREPCAGRSEHAVLTPLLVLRIQCFADAVGLGQQQVAGLERDVAFLILRVGQQPDHRATALQSVQFVISHDEGRVVAGIDVAEQAA